MLIFPCAILLFKKLFKVDGLKFTDNSFIDNIYIIKTFDFVIILGSDFNTDKKSINTFLFSGTLIFDN